MKFKEKIIFFVVFLLCFFSVVWADGIDSTDKWAWWEDIWWLNFWVSGGNVDVTNTEITGFAWSDNYGWINMSPSNSGVNNTINWLNWVWDCYGQLSWKAWGDNLWWIDFSGVRIDENGYFSWTWTWVNSWNIYFSGSTYKLRTDWRPDCVKPVTPSSSPTMTSWAGNVTTDTTPDFTWNCSENGGTINLYIDGAIFWTWTCSSGTFSVTSSVLTLWSHSVKFSEKDLAWNESDFSPLLSITIESETVVLTWWGGSWGGPTPVKYIPSSLAIEKMKLSWTGTSESETGSVEIVEEDESVKEFMDDWTIKVSKSIEGNSVEYFLKDDYPECSVIDNVLLGREYMSSYKSRFLDLIDAVNKEAIVSFEKTWIVHWTTQTTFEPKKEISRVEFLKIVLRSHCYTYDNEDTSDLEFVDVDKSSWEAKVIKKWVWLWIIKWDTAEIDGRVVETPIWVSSSKEDVLMLQNTLKIVNLYYWEIDGVYNSDLRDSIFKFQLDNWVVKGEDDLWVWYWGVKTRETFKNKYWVGVKKVFRGTDSISKIEAISILFRMALLQLGNSWYENTYLDITVDWQDKYVSQWEYLWVFNPEETNGIFAPDSKVSRDEMVGFIVKTIGLYR